MKTQTFRKLTAVVLAVMLMLSMCMTGLSASAAATSDGTTVVYLKPNKNWQQDSPRYAVYMYEGATNKWVDMADKDGDGYFSATLPKGNWTKIIFCRMSPTATANNWDNKWNQTADLDIPEGMNCYTVKEATWDKGGGTWSNYDPSNPSTDPTEEETEGTTKPVIAGDPDSYYLFGYINNANYGCEEDSENAGEYKFVDGKLTAKFDADSYVAVKKGDNSKWYMTDGWLGTTVKTAVLYDTTKLGTDANKLYVPANTEVTFKLTENADGTLTLSYGNGDTPTPTGATEATEGTTATTKDYYLFGNINGADYGCNDDFETLGEYKFVDGKLTANFKTASYVAVKTGDNANWFMTDGWAGIVTSVTLKNTTLLGENADKLMVPAGKVEFTLVENADGTLTLSYKADTVPTIPVPETTKGEESSTTGSAKDYYLFGNINGADYGCNDDFETLGEYKFVDGKLTATFKTASYVAVKTGDNANWYMTDGWAGIVTSVTLKNTTLLGENADKLMVPAGKVEFTLVENADGTLTLSYKADTVPTIPVPETTKGEESSTTGSAKDYYLFGNINGADYGCNDDFETLGEYKFVDGKLTATFKTASYVAVKTGDNANWFMTDGWAGIVTSVTLKNTTLLGENADKLMVPAGKVEFTLVENADGTLTLSYKADTVPTIPVPETTKGEESSTTGSAKDYYLFGYINGADYGCNDDSQTLGDYKFVDGKLTATFETASYVAVKTGDNANWYMTDGWAGIVTSVTLKNTTELGEDADKLMVPAGKVEFTLVENADGTLTLSYKADTAPTIPVPETTKGEESSTSGSTTDYYLFGSINGADYGCNDDFETIGDYKFVDGKLTVNFKTASYVAVKTGDNANWYMTDGWAGIVTSVTLKNTTELGKDADKLMVPAGEVEFTLVENADGTLTLSYKADTVPTIPVPETTAAETTVPVTTVPETTVPETTDPQPTVPSSGVSIFGDVNVELADNGNNTYKGSTDLEAGTYTFRVNENGTQMGYGGSFTDAMYGVQYNSAWKSATTFNATGGRYTFSYNTKTDRLTVTRKSFDDLVELFGDFNLELIKGSGTVFTGSVRLDAGTYQYRINDRGTTKCFGGSFNDAVVNLQYRAEWKSATTFNATGGLYTVKYDTATEKLTMLHSPAGVGDVRVFGDIELSLIKESDTMYSAATSLAEGTYEFRIDELGTMKCYGGTYNNEMFGVQYRSDWKGATVFNAKGGNYTFRYNIKESRLFIYYKAPTDKVSIFGDFNVEMTKTVGNIYKGTTTLEAGTYSFRIDEKGTTMCAGGTYTDKMSNVLYSADWKAATVFKATGGTYTFTYNAATDKLSVTPAA